MLPTYTPLLTDLYQLTMAYGYWKADRHNVPATFDLFFRKCPFKGEFAVFAGLSEVIPFLENFHFRGDRLDAVQKVMPNCDPAFYHWLRTVNASEIEVTAAPEGSVVFPRVPLLTVTGPLAIAQLLETSLLNLVNFPTLIATNAARFRLAAGPNKVLSEFGLRRAQGPDGAMSAAKYAYIGGFDSTSNVLASTLYGIPCQGTHAHAWVQSFRSLRDLSNRGLLRKDTPNFGDFVAAVEKWRRRLLQDEIIPTVHTNEGELAAFIAYAQAFPEKFLALVDTYNTLKSGIPNFLAVALALKDFGYEPLGIRLDSGDLSYLSKEARRIFMQAYQKYGYHVLDRLTIVASNDINEEVLHALNHQGHEIQVFGIGTHLVTCQAQPALGAVYKLVEINGQPRIKLSEEYGKMTIPGRKKVIRLFKDEWEPMADLMMPYPEHPQSSQEALDCWHPFDTRKRKSCLPHHWMELHSTVWNGEAQAPEYWSDIQESHRRALRSVKELRPDHTRFVNPTPYQVSVSPELYKLTQALLDLETY